MRGEGFILETENVQIHYKYSRWSTKKKKKKRFGRQRSGKWNGWYYLSVGWNAASSAEWTLIKRWIRVKVWTRRCHGAASVSAPIVTSLNGPGTGLVKSYALITFCRIQCFIQRSLCHVKMYKAPADADSCLVTQALGYVRSVWGVCGITWQCWSWFGNVTKNRTRMYKIWVRFLKYI